jgi:hypothetical protein
MKTVIKQAKSLPKRLFDSLDALIESKTGVASDNICIKSGSSTSDRYTHKISLIGNNVKTVLYFGHSLIGDISIIPTRIGIN